MHTKYFFTLGLISIAGLFTSLQPAIADNLVEPDKATLAAAMSKHLSQQGDFCLGKFDWPIAVSNSDEKKPTRDSVQMPVLEKLGLVVASSTMITRKLDDENVTTETVPGKSYALTEAGEKFYLNKELLSASSSGEKIVHHGDFCAGKLSLDKIIKWEQPTQVGENYETTVTYTYKIAAAEWTHQPEIQQVFPMVDRVVKGQGNMQLQQRFRLSGSTWVAVNPWE